MKTLNPTDQTIDFNIQPIITTIKLGTSPITEIICTSDGTIVVADDKAIFVNTFNPLDHRPATRDEIEKIKLSAKKTSFSGKCSVSLYQNKHNFTLQLQRQKRIKERRFYQSRNLPPYNGPVTSAVCFDGDHYMFWGIPGEIIISDPKLRHREENIFIRLPGIYPSAISYANGVLVVGSNQGQVLFLSFLSNATHFILSLAAER